MRPQTAAVAFLIVALAGAGIGLSHARSDGDVQASQVRSATRAADPDPAPSPRPEAFVRDALDTSVDACDDFYRRACQGFIARNRPTAAQPSVAMSDALFNRNLDRNLEKLFAQQVSGDRQLDRLKTFYASCQAPDPSADGMVKGWLAKIDRTDARPDFQPLLRELAAIGVDSFFVYDGQPDSTDLNRFRGELRPGLTRLANDPGLVERSFEAAGYGASVAQADARAVASIVNALKGLRIDRYDYKRAEHPMTQAQIARLAPAVDWPAYLALVHAPQGKPVNVTSPDHLHAVSVLLATRPPAELRAFLRWSFLFSLRGELPPPYNRPFGSIEPALRVDLADGKARCRDATVRAMGVEFSREYAERILGRSARDAARTISESIKRQIVGSVAATDWLSAQGRRATADKLAKTDLKIGFPDRWPEVGSYPLDRQRFLQNVLAARSFEQQRAWRRAGKPRSRKDWDMIVRPWVGEGMAAARLVIPNGYPDAPSNSLIMTAAFLAPPHFDATAAEERNYGTFGTVFAHEFVHVADNHDWAADGRPVDVWNALDAKAADARYRCVVDQADAYQPLPGLKMPGEHQLGENNADFGGVRLAFDALHARMGERVFLVDGSGTSPAQRFFYAYAQNHCTAQTDTNLRQNVATDGHAPPSFRVNGPLSNLPAFGKAFQCKAGAKMARPEDGICRVW